ncbi:DUF6287 domain-containing protein [Lacticaseibacillus sp. GG6-2]
MTKMRLGLTIGVCLLALGGAAGCGQTSKSSTKASSTTSSHSSHKTKPLLPVDKSSKRESSSAKSNQSSSRASASQASSTQSSQPATRAATVKQTTNTSTSRSAASSSAPAQSATMQFSAIQAGDYSSLVGNWREVAEAANYQDGNGVRYGDIKTPGPLTVTANSISTVDMTMKAGIITSNGQTGKMTFQQRSGGLTADGNVGAIAWTIWFYPKGTSVATIVDDPKYAANLDASREHVVARESNNDFVQVFERQ